MFDYFCKCCFENEYGICDPCAHKTNLCLNCVYYGDSENVLCVNCLNLGDEGHCVEYDLIQLFQWISCNDSYFLNV